MGRSAIQQMLYMMDNAFEGDPSWEGERWHAVLENLASVREDEWTWLPPDGRRSIGWIVVALGNGKYVYASHTFGDGSMHWDKRGSIPALPRGSSPKEVIDWLRGAQEQWRAGVEALQDDSELIKLRPSPFGDNRETRWMIRTMIEHDLYHAGEINHIRALAQRDD